ncbi:helicase associated domain-containing protein [Puerhibacterium puerhi]|uniref:helicase associated domain-containing protein n=1 Tax=Puerhibacterium puerhi TaxID=2692623 RepID=UPI001359BBAC|nr:helicase associated domain-containing protein [Puerhibacterium puerhi]
MMPQGRPTAPAAGPGAGTASPVDRPAWGAALRDLRGFVAHHGRLPSSGASATAPERALAAWLVRQRARAGGSGPALTAQQLQVLDAALPGWRDTTELRWRLHATAVAEYRSATGRWPSKHSADPHVARLGRWLHDQRAAAANPERPGRWSAARRAQLDELAPGWDGAAG